MKNTKIKIRGQNFVCSFRATIFRRSEFQNSKDRKFCWLHENKFNNSQKGFKV